MLRTFSNFVHGKIQRLGNIFFEKLNYFRTNLELPMRQWHRNVLFYFLIHQRNLNLNANKEKKVQKMADLDNELIGFF